MTGRDAAKLIWLDKIVRLQTGTVTSRFITAANIEQDSDADNELLVQCQNECLSIIHLSDDGMNLESLDILVPDENDYKRLVEALSDLMKLYEIERKLTVTQLQHLQYHWSVTLNKGRNDVLSATEWSTVCDKLQVPLKKSILYTMFTQDCGNMDSLTFTETARLLQDVYDASTELVTGQTSSLVDPLEKLWNQLVETDPVPMNDDKKDGGAGEGNDDDDSDTARGISSQEETISTVALLSFVRSQQKEFEATLPRVTNLVQTLNHQTTPEELEETENSDYSDDEEEERAPAGKKRPSKVKTVDSERITKTRFISFMTSDSNDVMDPIQGRDASCDLSQPLSAYWIHTAHDTYVKKQNPSWHRSAYYPKGESTTATDFVDEQEYMYALLRGVRCLELDVWDDAYEHEPVLCRYEPDNDTPVLALQTVLTVISTFMDQHPAALPIILRIENHCTRPVQFVMAKMLFEVLQGKIATPETNNRDSPGLLPSPDALRGKVVIMGKRPVVVKEGALVLQDDYDDDNDSWQIDTTPTNFWDEAQEEKGVVVGFSTKGPIRSNDADELVRTPSELVEIANSESEDASRKATEAVERAVELQNEATMKESLAAELTRKTGMSPEEVKRRAARAADRNIVPSSTKSFDDAYFPDDGEDEQKSPKDEGLEVPDFLSEAVEDGRDAYARAAQEAMEASQNVDKKRALFEAADEALKRTEMDLDMSIQREKDVAEQSRKAAAEARTNREHADAAKERIEKVRELLKNCTDKSSNAGTVVVTAMTEAKISEKRAAEAEARASRAMATADRDRQRADEETQKEEQLEREVASLHSKYQESMEGVVSVRERVEKAAAMLDRVNEQIKLIEGSSQFRRERGNDYDDQSPKIGGSVIAKHRAKLEEREICRELIKEASEENSAAELRRKHEQERFEEKAHMLRIQADHAASLRKQADRSMRVAEDLAEQADEEREAATLRQIARQKAEATVEHRDSHRESAEAQLAEAERASSEAAQLAVQSRKRADRLERELEKLKDHSRFEQAVEDKKWNLKQASGEYDAAKLEKERKDVITAEEKHRLDTNSEVFSTAVKDTSEETNRVMAAPILDQEAIVAYNQALLLRKEAELAAQLSKSANYTAKQKALTAQRALEYKEKMDM